MSVCLALVMQYSMRMRHIVISLACLAVRYFSTLSHKRHDFWGEKIIEYRMYVLISSTTFA